MRNKFYEANIPLFDCDDKEINYFMSKFLQAIDPVVYLTIDMGRKGFLYQFFCQSNYRYSEESIPTYYLLAIKRVLLDQGIF